MGGGGGGEQTEVLKGKYKGDNKNQTSTFLGTCFRSRRLGCGGSCSFLARTVGLGISRLPVGTRPAMAARDLTIDPSRAHGQ